MPSPARVSVVPAAVPILVPVHHRPRVLGAQFDGESPAMALLGPRRHGRHLVHLVRCEQNREPLHLQQIGRCVRNRRLCCRVARKRLLASIRRHSLHGNGHWSAIPSPGPCFFFFPEGLIVQSAELFCSPGFPKLGVSLHPVAVLISVVP